MRVVLENSENQIIRNFELDNNDCILLKRHDTGRIVVLKNLDSLLDEDIGFDVITEFNPSVLTNKNIEFGGFKLRSISSSKDSTYFSDVHLQDEQNKVFGRFFSLLSLIIIGLIVFSTFFNQPVEEEVVEPEEKEITIVEPPKRIKIPKSLWNPQKVVPPTRQKIVKPSLNRIGALGVLGQLSKSNTKGGVDMSAVKSTGGAGLGGTGGSGGVQTSMYGKGAFKAALGPGNNFKGAGGYGTKGAGGGKAGYGKMSLVGKVGSSTFPLTSQATVGGGLDMDSVAAVIKRHMGQVRFCYEKGLNVDKGLKGRVAINFAINSSGRVASASVASTTLNSQVVESCIVSRLKSWKFPIPRGGKTVAVTFPFLLKRTGR